MAALSEDAIPSQAPAPVSARILLSAYACEPNRGSEPGIGWRWARQLAAAGHEVCVLTRENNREVIEAALPAGGQRGLRFEYYDLPRWARWWKKGGRGVYLYYLLWQLGAYRVARRLSRSQRFDLVHHLTFGVFRQPSLLAALNVPFIFGPVGGGESTPLGLRRGWTLRACLSDELRALVNSAVRFDPLLNLVLARAAVILCKTAETVRAVPARYRSKCRVFLEVAIDPSDAGRGEHDVGRPFAVLHVGRLLHWKGLYLAIPAFARLLAANPQARFTIVGQGPEKSRLQRYAHQHGVAHAIDWHAQLEQREVMALYRAHDVFLFPSLHDSSGNVVLESLSQGLPVVCMNVGGPAAIIDDSCGVRVDEGDADAAIEALGAALVRLAKNPGLRDRLARGALLRAEDFSWSRQVSRMNEVYAQVLKRTQASGAGR